MTFIKLDEENFVNTKIINRFKVEYKSNDSETFLYDNNINSKSIIYSQPNTHGSFSNSMLGLQEDANLNNSISSFFNFANKKIDYTSTSSEEIRSIKDQYFEQKKSLSDSSVTNENLKKFNFKNAFKINRTVNTFLPCSFEMSKFETVKNNLYNFYNNDFSKDFYPELDYGYCNYNTINFFSQKYDSSRVHSNCLVYSNQKNINTVNDVNFSNDFSINLWINIRKNNNVNRGCIMHIPDVFSLYSIEGELGYKICIVTGSDSKKTLNNSNFANIDFQNASAQLDTSIFLTNNNTFSYNSWHNLTINFDNISQNKYLISLYKDGNIVNSFNISIVREKQDSFDSFICIGNKPYYFREALNNFNTDYEDIFYTFFGKNYSSEDGLTFDGPFYKKDLNIGSNTSYVDNKFINDIIINNNLVYFDDTLEKNSSFHGEMHGIKIYSNTLSEDKIESLFKNSIKDLNEEKETNSLSFFVPVYYLPLSVKKVGLFNCELSSINLYYNSIYNPFFANSSLGRDVSLENYLVDFVSSKKPNVIISGFDSKNLYKNYYEELHKNFIDNEIDISKIKKGIGAEDIFLDNLENMSIDNVSKFNNISYRNLLVTPNDNGIPRVSFDVIDHFFENDSVYNKSKAFFKVDKKEKFYHIDCYNTLEYVQYSNNERLKINRDANPGNKIVLNIDNDTLDIPSSRDIFYDISNYFYHDENILKVEDFNTSNNNIDKYIIKCLDNFNKVYTETTSNPINRNYRSSDIVFRNNDLSLDEDLAYKVLPAPFYSLNNNDLSLFSQIIDVSSQYYNKKIKKGSLNLKDKNLIGTNGVEINISDNGKGYLFRNDCLTKVADWNYIGHIFYKEGILTMHHTSLYGFGKKEFEIDFISEGSVFVHETNIPIRQGQLNFSNNSTYNKDLRLDESAFNSDEPFIYITDVNIHDENLNIVAKAKMAHPIPKKNTDNLLIRLKMDY